MSGTNGVAEFCDEIVVEDCPVSATFDYRKPSSVLPSLVIFLGLDENGPFLLSRLGNPRLDKRFVLLASNVLFAPLHGAEDFRRIDVE